LARRKKMMKFYLMLVASLTFPTLCIAASFDCQKASSTIEKIICSNAELSTEDENLASSYKEAQKISSEKRALTNRQKEWLRERNRISDPDVILMMYRNRILEINKQEYPKKLSNTDYHCASWEQKVPLSTEFNKITPEIYYQKCSDKPLNRMIKIRDVILFPDMSVESPDIDSSLSPDGSKLVFALTTVWEKNVWVINIKASNKEFYSDIFPGRQLLIKWIDSNNFSLTYCSPGVCEEHYYKYAHNKWKPSNIEFIEEGDEGISGYPESVKAATNEDTGKEVQAFFLSFRDAISKGDKIKVAKMITFPVEATLASGKRVKIKNEEKFIQIFEEIFDTLFVETIAKKQPNELWADSDGVATERGEIWFNGVTRENSGKYELKIIGINGVFDRHK
jgi:uncharacterized protein